MERNRSNSFEDQPDSQDELILSLVKNGVFQWKKGLTSPEMRQGLKVIDSLHRGGMLEDEKALNDGKMAVMTYILAEEIRKTGDIAEDLAIEASQEIEDFNQQAS